MKTTRRMLHSKISLSLQVNRLAVNAQLLFTWLISHADDDGKLKGDPQYIKATAVPMKKWSFKLIKQYLEQMHEQGLIYYWEQNNEWFIEFSKWKDHQYIQKDRYHPSDLPSYPYKIVNNLDASSIQSDDVVSPEINTSKSNEIEIKKSEQKEIEEVETHSKGSELRIHPKTFVPKTETEVAALEAWKTLEPMNPFAFVTTYLWAERKGIPASLFYQFVSEIKQDKKIQKRGAVFRTKAENYIKEHNELEKLDTL